MLKPRKIRKNEWRKNARFAVSGLLHYETIKSIVLNAEIILSKSAAHLNEIYEKASKDAGKAESQSSTKIFARIMNGHTWTCSDACKEALAWKIARQNNEVHTCPTCGKEFIEKSNCIVCRKEFDCSDDQLARPLCSKECQDIFREKLRKNTEEEIKRLELAKREQLKKSIKSYILHNGFCGICRTSYILSVQNLRDPRKKNWKK